LSRRKEDVFVIVASTLIGGAGAAENASNLVRKAANSSVKIVAGVQIQPREFRVPSLFIARQ
jgi:hypothetical protein